MIEIVALEIVDRGRRSPGADERIDLVVDEHQHARGGLVAIVLADDALARRRIIRLADAGGEQELGLRRHGRVTGESRCRRSTRYTRSLQKTATGNCIFRHVRSPSIRPEHAWLRTVPDLLDRSATLMLSP
jgi:hypothetical protein